LPPAANAGGGDAGDGWAALAAADDEVTSPACGDSRPPAGGSAPAGGNVFDGGGAYPGGDDVMAIDGAAGAAAGPRENGSFDAGSLRVAVEPE
jgi:hypothetical protein